VESGLKRKQPKKLAPPIGDAVLDLKGGMLLAEHALNLDRLDLIRRDRQVLFERIQNCKWSLEEENFPSMPSKFLRQHAPALISSAEAILQMLTLRLSSSIQLAADGSKGL